MSRFGKGALTSTFQVYEWVKRIMKWSCMEATSYEAHREFSSFVARRFHQLDAFVLYKRKDYATSNLAYMQELVSATWDRTKQMRTAKEHWRKKRMGWGFHNLEYRALRKAYRPGGTAHARAKRTWGEMTGGLTE